MNRARLAWISGAGAMVGALFSFAACESETIVLATTPADDGGSEHQMQGPRCVSDLDCTSLGPRFFCEKHTCGDPAGTCTPFPEVCSDDEMPTCGCNGITYFNDCLRRADGVSSAHPSECGFEAVSCGGGARAACPNDTECALLLGYEHDPHTCGPDVAGTCWRLPPLCSAPTQPDRWDPCDAGAGCVDTCTAIRAGVPHVRASRCN